MDGFGIFDPVIRADKYWVGVEACYSRTWQQYKMQPHFHKRAELMHVLKGKCLVHVLETVTDGDACRAVITRTEKLGTGEYIFLDAGITHALEVPQSCYMLNAEFRVRKTENTPVTFESLCRSSETFRRFLEKGNAVFRGVDREGDIHASLAQVVEDFTRVEASKDYRPVLDAEMCRLLLHIAQDQERSGEESSAQQYVRRAVRILHEHAAEDIRISDIADEIGIASAYLQRIFRQAKGETMIEYLSRMRIERSKLLLSRTDDSIVDIAVSVGYNSRQHFSRVFTKFVGVSPQEYRQNHRDYEKTQLFRFNNVDTEVVEYDS